MAIGRPSIIGVFPSSALADRPRLFGALGAAFGVAFRPYSDAPDADAAIVVADDHGGDLAAEIGVGRRPLFVASALPSAAPETRENVWLTDADALDRRLRGIELHDRLSAPLLPVQRRDAVLASARSGAAWTVRDEGAPVYRVRSVLAELEPHQVLWSMLSQRPIAIIALVQFLRAVSARTDWRRPALRAAFMFDDPNLRWRSYGFIDYRRLLAHAEEHGYHAAMATIPLDGARAHRPTARLFARRPDRLSLVVHGNDHVKEELHAVREQHRALAVAGQARRRIAVFEHRSGVRVDRVMTPPHGLCSEATTRALGAVGFDALCAEHALPWTDHLPPEKPLAAWGPADFVGGCAVIPRIPLDSSAASIALRAFLDQPLVIYGHHSDVAQGLDRLAEIAERVNRLGDVRWMSLGEIAHSNQELRSENGRAVVRPLARRIRLELPEHVRELVVDAPEDLLAETLSGWSLQGGPVSAFGELAAAPAGTGWLRLHGRSDVDARHVPAPAWRARPRLRRAAVEARDRALPLARTLRLMR
jgi:hypothetical protein